MLEAALDGGEKKVPLAVEESEHVGLSDADPPRDPLHRGAVQAAVRKLVHGGVDKRFAADRRRDARPRARFVDRCGEGEFISIAAPLRQRRARVPAPTRERVRARPAPVRFHAC